MVHSFFFPYISASIAAAYSLDQNIVGLPGRSVTHLPINPDLLTTIYALLIIPFVGLLMIGAALMLSWRLAIFFIAIWLSPGLLSLLGHFPEFQSVPEVFVIGGDFLGNHAGSIVNLALLFFLSWSLFIIFLHRWRKSDFPKYAFDHIWYTIGLAAAIFLVSDSNHKQALQSRSDAELLITNATDLLVKQTEATAKLCRYKPELMSQLVSKPQDFCVWVKVLSNRVWFLSNTNWVGRDFTEPPNQDSLLAAAVNKGISLTMALNLLREYNKNACLNPETTHMCALVPDEINSPTISVPYYQEYAIALEPIVNELNRQWRISAKETIHLKNDGPIYTFRWFFFLFIAALAGGKVSFATRSIFAKSARPNFLEDARIVISFLRKVGNFIKVSLMKIRFCMQHYISKIIYIIKSFRSL